VGCNPIFGLLRGVGALGRFALFDPAFDHACADLHVEVIDGRILGQREDVNPGDAHRNVSLQCRRCEIALLGLEQQAALAGFARAAHELRLLGGSGAAGEQEHGAGEREAEYDACHQAHQQHVEKILQNLIVCANHLRSPLRCYPRHPTAVRMGVHLNNQG